MTTIIRVMIGIDPISGDFRFRASVEGVDVTGLVVGDDAILHEDMQPVAALYSGTWVSSGNDDTTINLPDVTVVPFNILMNPGDGVPMIDHYYRAEWKISTKNLKLIDGRSGTKTFTWVVLVDL